LTITPVGFAELVADLGPEVARDAAVEAVEALARRSLLERGGQGTFTLHPVVLEYATVRLIATITEEILGDEPASLHEQALITAQALVKAQMKDYVRRSQERLIAQPLLERLAAEVGSAPAVERRLLELLEEWREQPAREQGYGPGNVVNLLRQLRGDLRGLDLSRLVIRQAYLQGVEARDARLTGSHLTETVLGEAFAYPTAVALSADGVFLAAGTPSGEVRLWRAADRTLLLAAQGHTGGVWSVALSGDGQLVASGGMDGTVRLWESATGRSPATLRGHTGHVRGVTLSGDGGLVASGSVDGTVKLWAAPSGQLLATLRGDAGAVHGLALSGDGRLMASGSDDGTVRLWATTLPLPTLQRFCWRMAGGVVERLGSLLIVPTRMHCQAHEAGSPCRPARGLGEQGIDAQDIDRNRGHYLLQVRFAQAIIACASYLHPAHCL
jgi:hypothetical protein